MKYIKGKKRHIKLIDKILYGFCAFYYLFMFLLFSFVVYLTVISIPDVIRYINIWKILN